MGKGRKDPYGVWLAKPRMPPWDTEYGIRIPISAVSLKLHKLKNFFQNEWKKQDFKNIKKKLKIVKKVS